MVSGASDQRVLLDVDRRFVNKITSPRAFEGLGNAFGGLGNAGRSVRCPDATLASVDRNVPTDDRTG